MIQISLVIKLVISATNALIQISLGLLLVMKQQMQVQISLVLTWSNASGAGQSNFIGYYAGYSAINAVYSNFIGYYAGYSATNASNSNFFGASAGNEATNAESSNFFGLRLLGRGNKCLSQISLVVELVVVQQMLMRQISLVQAGMGATNAYSSNFLVEMLVLATGANNKILW
jgi:hypothetical protein